MSDSIYEREHGWEKRMFGRNVVSLAEKIGLKDFLLDQARGFENRRLNRDLCIEQTVIPLGRRLGRQVLSRLGDERYTIQTGQWPIVRMKNGIALIDDYGCAKHSDYTGPIQETHILPHDGKVFFVIYKGESPGQQENFAVISCDDIPGNYMTATTEFNVDLSNRKPEITLERGELANGAHLRMLSYNHENGKTTAQKPRTQLVMTTIFTEGKYRWRERYTFDPEKREFVLNYRCYSPERRKE